MQNPILSHSYDDTKQVFKVIKGNPNGGTARVTWGRLHDQYLEKLVTKHKAKNWKRICAEMKERFPDLPINGKKCRERWITSIKHGINRLPLSDAEDIMLVIHHHTYRNRWSMISKKMPARNSSCLKNNFYSLLKKVVRQVLVYTQGQIFDEVPAVQFYSTLYVCVTLSDLLENQSSSPDPVSRTPPHILDFVRALKVTPTMCRLYLLALNQAFLKSSPYLDQPTRDLFGSADFDSLAKLFEETIALVPPLLSTAGPEMAICTALGKVAHQHAMYPVLPLPTFRLYSRTAATQNSLSEVTSLPLVLSELSGTQTWPDFLKPFLALPAQFESLKRSPCRLKSFPWPAVC